MKKLFVIISILGSIGTGSLYAQSKTPIAVVSSFQSSFNNASGGNWSFVKGLYQVDFTVDNENLTAFFDKDGNLVASSRKVTLLQIPLSLKSDLKKDFHNYEVANLFEVDKEDGIVYYATIKSDKNQLELRSTPSGDWVKMF
jgi:hypothetical protein